MNKHNEYLKLVETYLEDLEVIQRSKILSEVYHEILNKDAIELPAALQFANLKRSQHGLIAYSPKKKFSFWSFFLKFSILTLIIIVTTISLLVWKFTPILSVDEANNRIIFLGGLIDIDGKAGKLKVFNDYHFSDDSFSNDFQASIDLGDDKDEIIVNFKSGSFNLKNSKDGNFSLDCKLANPPNADIISQRDELVHIDFSKIEGLNCALEIPTDKKITIEGKQASLNIPAPEYNLYIELENGKIYLSPEEEIDYIFNFNIENKKSDNFIGDFKSSNSPDAYEIRINLQDGAVIRK